MSCPESVLPWPMCSSIRSGIQSILLDSRHLHAWAGRPCCIFQESSFQIFVKSSPSVFSCKYKISHVTLFYSGFNKCPLSTTCEVLGSLLNTDWVGLLAHLLCLSDVKIIEMMHRKTGTCWLSLLLLGYYCLNTLQELTQHHSPYIWEALSSLLCCLSPRKYLAYSENKWYPILIFHMKKRGQSPVHSEFLAEQGPCLLRVQPAWLSVSCCLYNWM